MVEVGTLKVDSWFSLNGYDYRVLAHWSTGVEIKGSSSYDDKRVIAADTAVTPA
jgi:hypothetical protein